MKLTQEGAIARDERRLAEEAEGRELPKRPLLEQMTLECAKENPSDLGTKVPENQPRSDQVSRLGIVAVISRFAVLLTTRAKWGCLDATEMVGAIGSVSALVINAGAGGAVAEMMLVWRAAMPAPRCSRAPEIRRTRRVCVRSIGVCSVRTGG